MIRWFKIQYYKLKFYIEAKVRRFKHRNDDPFIY